MREKTHLLALLAILVTGAACGGSGNDKKDGGADAPPSSTGGRSATGGTTGTSQRGGNVGSGGRATGGSAGGGVSGTGGRATGGTDGGAVGSGGTSAVAGAGGATRFDGGAGTGGIPGSGGRASGGATGTGGGAGGGGGTDAGGTDGAIDRPDVPATADGRVDAGLEVMADVSAEVGAEVTADIPLATDGPPRDVVGSGTLESCFAGLPAQVGAQMIATKSSADGRVRMRIALDTEDRMGTSGTYGWGLIRLAVEVDGAVTCIADRSFLRYGASHHNCSDTATATVGSTTYSIVAPDRPTATLTIEADGATLGPYTLSDTACTMFWSTGAPITCRSGAPC